MKNKKESIYRKIFSVIAIFAIISQGLYASSKKPHNDPPIIPGLRLVSSHESGAGGKKCSSSDNYIKILKDKPYLVLGLCYADRRSFGLWTTK